MRIAWATLAMLAMFPLVGSATPFATAEYGTVPQRDYTPRQDQCHLMYYNYCSGWTRWWTGYCNGFFPNHLPVKYGTCFDLADCPGECRNLKDVWFACWGFDFWGRLDIEIYCADQNDCPLGSPLGGIYGYSPVYGHFWQHFDFGGLPLCQCEETGEGKFIVMITDYTVGYDNVPYSDLNSKNIEDGCESQWRCEGHSFVYKNAVSYCDVYGAPGPLWWSCHDCGCTNYPAIPPGCHSYYAQTGHFCEWLIDCYVSCQGPTVTDRASWSEVKRLYR